MRWPRSVVGAMLLAALTGCAAIPEAHDGAWWGPDVAAPAAPMPEPREIQELLARMEPLAPPPEPAPSEVYTGTGVFVGAPPPRVPDAPPGPGDITLNFEAADVREVVKAVLGDILGQNYIIEPDVQGRVTLQTSRPLQRDALIPALESVLRLNGLALVHRDGLYRVVPLAAGQLSARPAIGRTDVAAGFQVRIVPLRYVSAEEMRNVLEPVAPQGGIVRVDAARNLLVLAGTGEDMSRMLDTVDIFDVDWLRGMSFALHGLQRAEPRTLAGELENVFGSEAAGPLQGMVRFVPVERLGAILVVSPQPRYLEAANVWIERLDRDERGEGMRLYVYPVQNGRAEHLAEILRELFAQREPSVGPPPARLAPGLTPVEMQMPGAEVLQWPGQENPARSEVDPAAPEGAAPAEAAPPPTRMPAAPRNAGLAPGEVGLLGVGPVGIIAEQANNALVILASPSDYQRIEAAIRRLDVVPLQVLVEASIVEVSLTGALSYGVQWFFNHALGRYTAEGTVGLPIAFSPSFSYTMVNAAGEVRALLALLAREGKINVISSPSLMVLDNQTANIRVGDQQPIPTAIITDGRVVAQSVQFKDTGVILEVTPRVNAGGLVRMDVRQEVTDVGAIDEATGQRGFLQRSITSSVAVQSGETVVLGGLIRENRNRSRSGVPGLYRLPVFGPLFGQTLQEAQRTELLVLITPRAIQDRQEARRITEELRVRMRNIGPEYDGVLAVPVRGGDGG
jgi:general secretion pathway protein D